MDRAVFTNYRSEDSASHGAWLYTELAHHFGDEHVFLDAESIPAGADYVEELLGRVRSARILLAVIGPRWLMATDPAGRRRIDDPTDWIRRELAEAFTAGDRPRALNLYQQALAMNRELNTPNNEALCLEGIADHHLATGNTNQGIEHLGLALQIYQRLGMRADIERVTNRLAGLAQQ